MRLLIAAFALLVSAAISAPSIAQDWHEAETNNFIIKSRSNEETTRKFAIELERFDMGLRTLQNMAIGEAQPSRATKLTIYRFGDADDIGRLQPGAVGFFIGSAGESTAYTPAREKRRRSMSVTSPNRNRETRLDEVVVLQHEYVHYFMRQYFTATYPSWYEEGYAELLASMRFNDDGSFHIGDPPQYRAYNIFRMAPFRLADMLDSKHELNNRDYAQFYGTGWLLSHYLNFDPARRAELSEYLTAIGAGEDSLAAAKRIFGDLPAIDRMLLDYRDGPFPGLDITPANYGEPKVSIRKMRDGEAAQMRNEIRLFNWPNPKEATSIAQSIKATLKDYPDDPHLLSLLARAELHARNADGADAAADRLIALAPDMVEGPLFKSEAALERAKIDPSWFKKSRVFSIEAAGKDANDPRPRINYYYSFFRAGETPPETAFAALEGAYDMAGSDIAFRLLLSHRFLIEDDLFLAKSVLLPVAFRGHDQAVEEERGENWDEPSLDKIITLIDAGDGDGAIAMIDNMFID